MSRSIHTTRRSVVKLQRAVSNSEKDQKELDRAYQELLKKRAIKRAVHNERTGPDVSTIPGATAAIPIEVLDESPGLLHAATKDDILAVLGKLPEGSASGVRKVQLSLGKECQEKLVIKRKDDSHICDPLFGRPGRLLMPGVYSGLALGTYFQRSGLVAVYGFVVIENELRVPLPVLRIYLKMQALKTLLHEVAHHRDSTARVKRGRWLADRTENLEAYANKMEVEWTLAVLVPYLEQACPEEVTMLLNWVEQHGGIKLPLSFLAADPQDGNSNQADPNAWTRTEAIEAWLAGFGKYQDQADSRFELAENFHLAGSFGECLQILEEILKVRPMEVLALLLKADTLVHLRRFSEAGPIIENLFKIDPLPVEVLRLKGILLEIEKDWPGLLHNTELRLSLPALKPYQRKYALFQRAIALCAKGDAEQLQKVTAELIQAGFFEDAAKLADLIQKRASKAEW